MTDNICSNCGGTTASGCWLCNPQSYDESGGQASWIISAQQKRISELEAKLDRVRELPRKWTLIEDDMGCVTRHELNGYDCADELDEVLADD